MIIKTINLIALVLMISSCGGVSSDQKPSSTAPDKSGNTEPAKPEVYVDSKVGLMWQDDVNAELITRPWLENKRFEECLENEKSSACNNTLEATANTYCSNLNLGGFSNWRLPIRDELAYLYNSGHYKILKHIIYKKFYWSSTTSDGSPDRAKIIGVFDWSSDSEIAEGSSQKNRSLYVRCVRNQ